MLAARVARRATSALRSPLSHNSPSPFPCHSSHFHTSSINNVISPGCGKDSHTNFLTWGSSSPCSSMLRTASFCSTAEAPEESSDSSPTEAVKEVYDKIVDSIKVKRSAPPNAWLWSLVEKSKSLDDIKLLFEVLQKLRVFRLSNLRIHDNFNCHLCQEVTKACVRVGALDFGKKALWKHNIYGLSPTAGSANQLLSFAKMKKDTKLMMEIMSLLKTNSVPLQPATADIVFSICYDADAWELISKYSRRFLKAGVKLRKTTFDTWMEFASRRGDVESLWKIEKLRSSTYKTHGIKSAFSCAKGLLLEKKPVEAASVIQAVNENFPDSKRNDIITEVQTLVSKWPFEVIKHQKQEDQKVLIASLKIDIPAMISSLSNLGLNTSVNMEDLKNTEPLPC